MKRVVVHIQSLVLKGFRFEDRHAVAQGLQEQLTHLLSAPDMAQRLGEISSIPRLHVEPVSLATEVKPQQVGRAVADGIGKGLNR